MRVILARPRGFCAGVERAIKCVDEAIKRFGPPVYVLNDIVHNAYVVNELREKGAIFVKNIDEVPEGAHLLFSAHGVGPDRWEHAKKLQLEVVDATCPLVEKVHYEARRFAAKDFTIILVGEPGHDETIGTMGWAPRGKIVRVLTEDDVESLVLPPNGPLAYLTQTTLSVQDCERVIAALKRRFPQIQGPPKSDICYATTNRQGAVRELAPQVDLVLVVGDTESANSTRLAEICHSMGKPSHLIRSAAMMREEWLDGVETILLTSGASAPEVLVQGVIEYLRARGPVEVVESALIDENVHFNLPRELAAS